MLAWAGAHDLAQYLVDRDGTHPPYGDMSEEGHLGEGHDLIVLPGGKRQGWVAVAYPRLY